MEFAFILKGAFRMGSPESEEGRTYYNERLHWVKLTEDYWMQTTEVTVGQWLKVMTDYPSSDDEKCWRTNGVSKEDDHPVLCVKWDDAMAFVNALNRKEKNSGYKYSLPTEAQWEYAARGYTESAYSIDGPLDSFAWFGFSSYGWTHMVGSLKANFFGLYDVHGHASEWVLDFLEKEYPKANSVSDAVEDPTGPKEGESHVLRGGSWISLARACRSANREKFDSFRGNITNGFRLVRTKR